MLQLILADEVGFVELQGSLNGRDLVLMVPEPFTHVSILPYLFLEAIQVFLKLELLLAVLFLRQFYLLDLVVDHFCLLN